MSGEADAWMDDPRALLVLLDRVKPLTVTLLWQRSVSKVWVSILQFDPSLLFLLSFFSPLSHESQEEFHRRWTEGSHGQQKRVDGIPVHEEDSLPQQEGGENEKETEPGDERADVCGGVQQEGEREKEKRKDGKRDLSRFGRDEGRLVVRTWRRKRARVGGGRIICKQRGISYSKFGCTHLCIYRTQIDVKICIAYPLSKSLRNVRYIIWLELFSVEYILNIPSALRYIMFL